MYISKQWLKQFIPELETITDEDIARSLTMKTVEVEGVEKQGEFLHNVVVGQVLSCEKHPDADKLKLCRVDIGTETVQIVCGGSNVREGMKVALGKIGAKVRWHGEGELVELVKAKIRGVESYGMICAADEIGLGDIFLKQDEAEILDLSYIEAPVGTPLADALGQNDVIFDIDNKSLSNRPDLFGQYGIAREVAAIHKLDLKPYEVPTIPKGKGLDLSVSLEAPEACLRYMAVAIDGVEVKDSPVWMQERLRAVGIRPINTIVDITNYVMMELGQPMHAFDVAQLARNKKQGASVLVRRAVEGETFVTLDEKEHVLSSEMLVIADQEKPIAIAGVMGGKNSEISDTTKTIIFESATFDAKSIRQTSTALGIRTDSSTRFEKSQDPIKAEVGLKRAVELTLELCPNATVVSSVFDEGVWQVAHGPLQVSLKFIQEKIGVEIPRAEILDILTRLGFDVKEKQDVFTITIPSWRATKDISIPEDVVEEIIRMYGYEQVPSTMPVASLTPPPKNALRALEHRVRELLAYEGSFTEVYSYSFNAPELLNGVGENLDDYLELENPIAKDRPFIRRRLVYGLLEHVEKNVHRFDTVKMFEVGKVFSKHEPGDAVINGEPERLPKQDTLLGAVYAKKGDDLPFAELLSVFEQLCERLGVSAQTQKSPVFEIAIAHPGRYADIVVSGTVVGYITELHPAQQERFGIPYRVALLEINLNDLLSLVQEKEQYEPLSLYPAVERDIAIVVERSTEHATLQQAIQEVNPLIVAVELFDVYQGDTVGEGKKSMAYHVVYQSKEKTLEAGEVEKVHREVISMLEKKFGAEMRK